jgi:glycerol-3-phosphate acyltransferase PlsY
MEMSMPALIIASYLLGSIPFGLLIAKAHGKDLRSIGSGNIGATNVSRALGKKWAYVCFLLDVSKGFVPTFIASFMIGASPKPIDLIMWLAVGCAAVAGHIFPVYIRFKGGKGVATSLGIGLGLWPYYTLSAVSAFAVWGICVLITRYVSLSSIIGSFAFLAVLLASVAIVDSWQFANLWPLIAVGIFMPMLITYRHRDNIKRLMAGTENKIFSNRAK